MICKIVIGLGFGDEGKGITTDHLCSESESPIVVRFSGGHQAGHNVVLNGVHHTYSTFGSGTGRGIPTFISEYCTFHLPNAYNEYLVLCEKGYTPSLHVHPLTKLVTYYDVAYNRIREGILKHGSCGMGFGATMARNEQSPYKLFVCDLISMKMLEQKLESIGSYYREKFKELGISMESNKVQDIINHEKERFYSVPLSFRQYLIAGLTDYYFLNLFETLIFEGSQGILLDRDHGIFPNVTYSHTTSKNVFSILERIDTVSRIDTFYVTRCYSTRHGNGWMPPENVQLPLINTATEVNKYNDWQGEFRISELDPELIKYAIMADSTYYRLNCTATGNLVITCVDQRPEFNSKNFINSLGLLFNSAFESCSPESKDFREVELES